MVLADSPELLQHDAEDFKAAVARYDAACQSLTQLPADAQTRDLLRAVSTTREAATPYTQQVLAVVLDGKVDQATRVLRASAVPGLIKNQDAVKAVLAHEEAKMAAVIAQGEITVQRAYTIVVVVMLLAIAAGIISGFFITRSLTCPLARAAAAARSLANGRLDGPVLIGGHDETGEVLHAVQHTRQSLQTLIEGIHQMGREHDKGNISFRPDMQALQGEYLTISQQLDADQQAHPSCSAVRTPGIALCAGRPERGFPAPAQ